MVFFEGRASILSVRRLASLAPKQSPTGNAANTSLQIIAHQTNHQHDQAYQKQLYIHVFFQKQVKNVTSLLNNITNADYKVFRRSIFLQGYHDDDLCFPPLYSSLNWLCKKSDWQKISMMHSQTDDRKIDRLI
jgi:hypothetical protein